MSTQLPPALRMSVLRLGQEVRVRPRTRSASTSSHGAWQITAAGLPASGRRFGRCPTGDDGGYRIVTVRPAALPTGDGQLQAPHIDVSVFARGLLDRVVTRIYFPDEAEANAADPVLCSIDERLRRDTLIATADGAGAFRFDIRLQGDGETVFFDA